MTVVGQWVGPLMVEGLCVEVNTGQRNAGGVLFQRRVLYIRHVLAKCSCVLCTRGAVTPVQ